MAILPLQEVLRYDNGENTADSFFVGPFHHSSQDFNRLICDLLLMTREHSSPETGVVFADLPELIGLAAERMSRRVDEITKEVAVVEAPAGLLRVAKRDKHAGARTPTPGEVSGFDGESRILYDGANKLEVSDARRLFAAWGVYCCERALRGLKAGGHALDVAVLVASAGALLGHANWCEAFGTLKNKATDERRRGGLARLVKNRSAAAKQEAKNGAYELWLERRAGKHPKLGTVEQFATEVMRRWPVLISSKVICGWSSKWTKKAGAAATPPC